MKIDKGIPIPETRGRKTKYEFVAKMKKGDSVLVKDANVAAVVRRRLAGLGRDGTSRAEGKQIRVWRIK